MTDIYQDEALQDKILEMWDSGHSVGEIIIELKLDVDETIEFLKDQGVLP